MASRTKDYSQMIMHGQFFGQNISVLVHDFIFSPKFVRVSTKNSKNFPKFTDIWSKIWVSELIEPDLIKNRHFYKTRIFVRNFQAEKTDWKFRNFPKILRYFKNFTYFSKASYFQISVLFSLYRVFQIFLLKTYFTDFQKPK